MQNKVSLLVLVCLFAVTAGVPPAASAEGASALTLARFPSFDRYGNGRRDACGPSENVQQVLEEH